MRKFIYRRTDGSVLRMEAEAMFWHGSAAVLAKGGTAVAVISLLPGDIIFEQGATVEEEQAEAEQEQKPAEPEKKPN